MDRTELRERLRLSPADVERVSAYLTRDDNPLIDGLLDVVERHGGVDEINRQAEEAGRFETRLARLHEEGSPHLAGLEWLIDQRDRGAFVRLEEYRHGVLGATGDPCVDDERADDSHAVTLEISALNFFPWLLAEARRAIARRELMPARYIRVRSMAEQSATGGDLVAVAAAMQAIGATHVETLDTRGIDGSNCMLGGPDTITGYFGGIGQPNDYPLKWADEYLHYLTEYGVREVLNVNSGTVLVALLLNKLGVDNAFKVSVFMGVDNPFSTLWLLMGARLLARDDGRTSLSGLNLANAVDTATLRSVSAVREALALTDDVRFEHHVTEAYRHIVRQPYDRRADVVDAAADVANLSAKHEGGDPEVEAGRDHPSDILDYFIAEEEIERRGLMPVLERAYLDKHAAVNRTAAALIEAGVGVRCAAALHDATVEVTA